MSSSFKAFSQLEKPRLASKKAIQKITQDIYLPSENTLECRALKIPLLSRTHFRHTLPQRPRLSPQPSSDSSHTLAQAPSLPPHLTHVAAQKSNILDHLASWVWPSGKHTEPEEAEHSSSWELDHLHAWPFSSDTHTGTGLESTIRVYSKCHGTFSVLLKVSGYQFPHLMKTSIYFLM